MTPRRDTIHALINAANEGMASVALDASAAEVFSAYFSLTAAAIEAAKQMGVSSDVLQHMVMALLVRCDDPSTPVM